eukprot:349341_1
MSQRNIIPQILKTINNKDGSITIVWKLAQASNCNTCFKLECAEDEKQLDIDCIKNQIIDIKNIDIDKEQKTTIKFDNIKLYTSLCFRFSQVNYLNAASIELIDGKPFDDCWNEKQKGDLIEVNGNIIKGCVGNKTVWNSIYGTKICESPNIYHWRFKIITYTKFHFMVGVVNSEQTNHCNGYTGSEGIFYNNGVNSLHIYKTQHGNLTLDQGCKNFGKPGDVLDMWLDLQKFELTYSINGQDMDIRIKMPKQKYILIASMHGPKKEIELYSSHYIQNTGC